MKISSKSWKKRHCYNAQDFLFLDYNNSFLMTLKVLLRRSWKQSENCCATFYWRYWEWSYWYAGFNWYFRNSQEQYLRKNSPYVNNLLIKFWPWMLASFFFRNVVFKFREANHEINQKYGNPAYLFNLFKIDSLNFTVSGKSITCYYSNADVRKKRRKPWDE